MSKSEGQLCCCNVTGLKPVLFTKWGEQQHGVNFKPREWQKPQNVWRCGEELEVWDTENIWVNITGPKERAHSAVNATPKAFTLAAPLPALATPLNLAPRTTMDSNMVMMMFQQMQLQLQQAQVQMQQQIQMFQESILAMRNPSPSQGAKHEARVTIKIWFGETQHHLHYVVGKMVLLHQIIQHHRDHWDPGGQDHEDRATVSFFRCNNKMAQPPKHHCWPERRHQLKEYIKGSTNPMVCITNTLKFKQRENNDPKFYSMARMKG